jgi:hypothetical protein
MEDLRAAKRAEIEIKVAAAKAEREKQDNQKAEYFGTHDGISCDKRASSPILHLT